MGAVSPAAWAERDALSTLPGSVPALVRAEGEDMETPQHCRRLAHLGTQLGVGGERQTLPLTLYDRDCGAPEAFCG